MGIGGSAPGKWVLHSLSWCPCADLLEGSSLGGNIIQVYGAFRPCLSKIPDKQAWRAILSGKMADAKTDTPLQSTGSVGHCLCLACKESRTAVIFALLLLGQISAQMWTSPSFHGPWRMIFLVLLLQWYVSDLDATSEESWRTQSWPVATDKKTDFLTQFWYPRLLTFCAF